MTEEVRARRYIALDEVFRSPLAPGISVLVPAFNEETVIVESVRSLLALRYPRHEVVVVSDGSTDNTIGTLNDVYDLAPVRKALRDSVPTAAVRGTYVSRSDRRLLVVDKENGGRSDVLNAGLNAARHPYVCVIDADSLLEEDALLEGVQADPRRPGRAGGHRRHDPHRQRLPRRLRPGCRGTRADQLARRVQVVEYLRAFLVGRVGWSRIERARHHLRGVRAVPPLARRDRRWLLVRHGRRGLRAHSPAPPPPARALRALPHRLHLGSSVLDRGTRGPRHVGAPAKALAAWALGGTAAAPTDDPEPPLRCRRPRRCCPTSRSSSS